MLVDVHVHVGAVESFAPALKGWIWAGIKELLSYMDEVDVDWVVLLSAPPRGNDPFSRLVSNEKLLKIAGRAGDRFVPFCVVDPRGFDAINRFKRLVRRGCRGLGELKVSLRADDPRMLRLLKVAQEMDLPVLFHMEEEKYFYDISSLVKVLSTFPKVRFIAHGPGWWKHISGERTDEVYPKGKVRKEGMVQKILRSHKNIFADISATSGLNALARDREYAKKFLREFSDRVMFGTDFPCLASDCTQYGPNRHHLNFLESLGLPSSILENILYRNAERVLA